MHIGTEKGRLTLLPSAALNQARTVRMASCDLFGLPLDDFIHQLKPLGIWSKDFTLSCVWTNVRVTASALIPVICFLLQRVSSDAMHLLSAILVFEIAFLISLFFVYAGRWPSKSWSGRRSWSGAFSRRKKRGVSYDLTMMWMCAKEVRSGSSWNISVV